MKSRYVKSFAIAAFSALGILPVLAQAQLVDLGVATGYANTAKDSIGPAVCAIPASF